MWEEFSEDYLKKLIIGWYERSQGRIVELTSFDKFICLWISFNAWGTHESQKDHDRDMIEWAKKNDLLRETFNTLTLDPDFNNMLKQFKNMCPTPRHRTWKGPDKVTTSDIKKWNEVLEAIYVMRCNLIHGRKSLRNIPDMQLVDLAYEILGRVFNNVITRLKNTV